MRNYIGSLDAIAEMDPLLDSLPVEQDKLIQLSCCANKRFKSCMLNAAKKHCKSTDSLDVLKRTNSNTSQRVARKRHNKAMKNMMQDFESTISEMSLTGPEIVCRGVKEDFCVNHFDNSKYTGRSPISKSIVPPMLTIYAYRQPK